MARVKRGTKRVARRRKILKRAKGYFLTKSKLYQSAKEAVERALRYGYRDRRTRKREFRKLWIQRLGVMECGGATPLPRAEGLTSAPHGPYPATRFPVRG